MIDAKQKRGDAFKFLGVIACDPDPDFTIGDLAVESRIRKASGGPPIQALVVGLGAQTTENGLIVVPFTLTAPYTDTATWPVGTLSFDVQITYRSERVSTRSILVSCGDDDT